VRELCEDARAANEAPRAVLDEVHVEGALVLQLRGRWRRLRELSADGLPEVVEDELQRREDRRAL
jgi:hypothetical protein